MHRVMFCIAWFLKIYLISILIQDLINQSKKRWPIGLRIISISGYYKNKRTTINLQILFFNPNKLQNFIIAQWFIMSKITYFALHWVKSATIDYNIGKSSSTQLDGKENVWLRYALLPYWWDQKVFCRTYWIVFRGLVFVWEPDSQIDLSRLSFSYRSCETFRVSSA